MSLSRKGSHKNSQEKTNKNFHPQVWLVESTFRIKRVISIEHSIQNPFRKLVHHLH